MVLNGRRQEKQMKGVREPMTVTDHNLIRDCN
jgi:hypothetical protein